MSASHIFREELILKILQYLRKKDKWFRVVALDLETKVLQFPDDFLTNEFILGINVARMQSNGKITSESFILKNESLKAEFDLLKDLNKLMGKWQPLCMTGFGCRAYDFPLLTKKLHHHEHHANEKLWKVSNILKEAMHIDLSNLVPYLYKRKTNEKIGYLKLDEIMKLEFFKELQFKKGKELISNEKVKKGHEIYECWKTKDPKFKQYLDSECHNILLIANKLLE